MYQQTDSDKLQWSIRIPIETETEFQRAFNASFDRLPIELVCRENLNQH